MNGWGMMDNSSAAPAEAQASAPGDTGRPDMLAAIRSGLPEMSRGQQQIAALFLDRPEWAVQANVADLAARAGVSAPTIVRFARAVGCDGLKDFKLKLAASIALSDTYLHRAIHPGDGAADVIRNVLGSLRTVLGQWESHDNLAELQRAAGAIAAAGRVDCYGTGATSVFLAQDLHAKLFRLGISGNTFSDAHFQLVGTATLGPGDVLLAISYVGRMPTLLEPVALARARGATVIAITQSGTTLAAAANIVLRADVPRDATMKLGTEAYIVQLVISEIVTVLAGLKKGAKASERLRQIHSMLQTHGVDRESPVPGPPHLTEK